MIKNRDVRQTDKEILSYSISLYRTVMSAHMSSSRLSKRSVLLLYLYGWRYITRRQINTLTSYNNSSLDAITVSKRFISNLVTRDGLLKKCSSNNTNPLEDIYTLTFNGIAAARELYIAEINRIYDEGSLYYLNHVNAYLLNARENIEEYADIFEAYIRKWSKNKQSASLHRLSIMDSYISFLRHLNPAIMAGFGTEVKFNLGEAEIDETVSTRALSTDVRSDAVFYLALERRINLANVDNNNTQVVCIEQDMIQQRGNIIADKIERYINLVALPRFERYGIPLTLVFSVVPTSQSKQKKDRTGIRPVDQRYIEEIARLGLLYCSLNERRPDRVALSELARDLKKEFCNEPLFQKHIQFLDEHMEDYGKTLPVSDILEKHTLLLEDTNVRNLRQDSKEDVSYARRKAFLFSVASEAHGIELMAQNGFSLCCTNNYDASSLISLFPELSGKREIIAASLSEKEALNAEFIPFYKYTCRNGVEIMFRNAYRFKDTVYVIENISNDYCSTVRLELLLKNEPDPKLNFIATFPIDEYVAKMNGVGHIATSEQRSHIYACPYRVGASGEPVYESLTPHNLIPYQ